MVRIMYSACETATSTKKRNLPALITVLNSIPSLLLLNSLLSFNLLFLRNDRQNSTEFSKKGVRGGDLGRHGSFSDNVL